jgi:cell division inhibitor SepF
MTDNNEKTITVVKPHDFSKTREYIDVLKTGNGLIIDFSSASILDGQKILDYLCGATYALDAKIERIDNNLYLMTPKSVKIVTKM